MSDKKHGHVHHSKSTKDILSAEKVLEEAGLKNGDKFLDAGCGDGFISFKASELVGIDGYVTAIDVYPDSIKQVENEINETNIVNMKALVADITERIPLESGIIDLCVMANVMHGFVENDEIAPVMSEITRVIKQGGAFVVVEFKKIEGLRGPPFEVRLAPQELEDILTQYGFEVTKSAEVGKYHYLTKGIKK